MLVRSLVKKMNPAERSKVRDGALFTTIGCGAIAYFNYRERIRKDFLRSEAFYRFSSMSQNMTPWKQLWFTWWRMPEQEFDAYHRFRPYFIIGQLDYSKEILIPQKKNGSAGYMVVNPLYCYEGGKVSVK